MRKRPPTVIEELTEVYNEAANKTITNLALEQKGDYKRAVDGWKALHTQVLFKIDIINKAFTSHHYTADELYVREGIEDLLLKGVDHQERVENALRSQQGSLSSLSSTSSHHLHQQSTYTVPTLRSGTPQSFTVRREQQEGPKPQRLLKTLRSDHKPLLKHSAKSYTGYGSNAKQAHDILNNGSSSLTSVAQRQGKPVEDVNIFDKSFEDDFDSFGMTLSREDTLKQLEASGKQSKSSRHQVIDLTLDDLDINDGSQPLSPPSNTISPTKTNATPPVSKLPTLTKSNTAPPSSTVRKATPRTATRTTRPTATTTKTSNVASKPPVKKIVRPGTANSQQHQQQQPRAGARAVKTTASIPSRSQTQSQPQSRQALKPPMKKERARSESPSRGEKDTETLDSDNADEELVHLSEKEIREKMEDQIIEEIRGIDYNAAKQIFNEIVVRGDEVHWDDIAGLETAKNSLKETVVYPFLRPDLFSGLREPARGMLLFGPPGTGKTMLARAVATESKSTFFSISASSLTSKYLGESEKLVRALFQLAKKLSPAIIFVDEIDSLLSSRSEGENESSRRIKNEFLIQWSDLTHAAAGKDTGEDLQRVLVLAATNLPWAIDEAARRRFVRRQYIPLPEPETRLAQIRKLLAHQKHTLDEKDQAKLVELTDGFSGSDITALAKDAAMGPLRSLGDKLLETDKSEIRPIGLEDFESSLKYIRPSVSKEHLVEFDEWAKKFGSSGV
ncbi:putative AAA family ATPase SAP1 [Cyberlindnera jadinii NRRL Y-1542]|uniref:AAA-domain-containing protein n=1 Tax=Cyberlindnera jadinii (strain ATCC 18201 / CBS 1600 / BCRC 20928 / JCM 3617 / NBRC 0987 / NRRL Y-1542) TaxID=983966 RepID=A0A1E4RYM3_CYBJN|nr:AAA-domain-containing protein [Cyberlindnera jadinii NRRL Y-1542]ODV72377.1 AAA-domain-containing protein [Cyberlindnera jadinii NRRL Y-1542]